MASILKVDQIKNTSSSGSIEIPSGYFFKAPGMVVQVASNGSTGVLNLNSSTLTDLPGYSISFTPKFSNSRLLITYGYHIFTQQESAGAWASADDTLLAGSTTVIGATSYGVGGNYTSTTDRTMEYVFKQAWHLVSSTNAVTYKVQVKKTQGSTNNVVYNNTSYGRGGRLTIQEVAQ